MSKKTLIAYFSHGGSTKKVAQLLARLTGGDVVEIEPVEAYPEDEAALEERSKAEIQAGAHPAITVKPTVDVAAYEAVLVGSPNWWGSVAAPVATFVAENDLSGKVLSAFCSEAGDTMAKIDGALGELAPNADVRHGLSVFNGAVTDAQAKAWLENIEVL